MSLQSKEFRGGVAVVVIAHQFRMCHGSAGRLPQARIDGHQHRSFSQPKRVSAVCFVDTTPPGQPGIPRARRAG
jgi:hypothetical protein